MNRTPQPRRVRRERVSEPVKVDRSQNMPGLLRMITNPRVFLVVGAVMLFAMVFSLFAANLVPQTTSDGGPMQANELPDVPQPDADGNIDSPNSGPTPVAVRYTVPPEMTIDASKRYTATITTPKGAITLELYPDQAPEAVNAFVFLAREGYYTGTSFLDVASNADGSRFTAQAGDPTNTGFGSPGFSIRKEISNKPFVRGAVGMGGASPTSNGGQFFISYGDYPALNGKYTIFGQITSGLDVLDQLTLLEPAKSDAPAGDTIESIVIEES